MEFEELVLKNRSENRQFLKELGLLKENSLKERQSFSPIPVQTSTPNISKKSVKRKSISSKYLEPSRRSNRIRKIKPPKYTEEYLEKIEAYFIREERSNERSVKENKKSKQVEEANNEQEVKREKVKRENVFGAIPDVSIGTEFSTRLEASAAGIHRPTVAGIHGNPSLGCYSLALSGGYEDDVDLGESFIYTGEGGRDLKETKANPKNLRTAPQSKDQVLERGNLALSMNVEHKLPVRVLRGYKLRSKYAPVEGYRYDGLYNVVEYYITKGISGFNVYKFRMERIKDQDPAPWVVDKENIDEETKPELSPKTDVEEAENC